jgi:D-amino-acid oxidase
MLDALIIGAGVVGLSTAIRLQEASYQVTIWTAALPHATTSSVAAALWYPYRAYPEDRVLDWGRRAYRTFAALAGDPAAGVLMRSGIELWRTPVPDPWWRDAVPQFGRLPAHELPPPYHDGYVFEVPVIDMSIYLDYLVQRFWINGGCIEQRVVRSLDEAIAEYSVVVNCTGMGARELVGDAAVQPIRGQIVRVRNPGLTRFVLDEEHPDGVTYVVPRMHDCILGGSANQGCWDTTPDPQTAAAILERCTALEPRLRNAEVLEHKVGLRPGRPAIRLEREDLPNGAHVVHNYGHGGAGVTLSWGCANEARALVQAEQGSFPS